MLRRPVCELPDEVVRDFIGPLTPWVLLVRSRIRFGELRDGELIEIHEAGGVVDDETDRHPIAGIEDGYGGILNGAFPGFLTGQ